MSLNIDFSQHRVFEVLITPELAEEILSSRNGANRNISIRVVDKYAKDMCNGNWMENEQNKWIGFYSDGNLADGQHRLKAISQSGIARVMKAETGLDRSQSFGIDAHRMRNMADQIKISDTDTWVKKNEIAITKVCVRALTWGKMTPSPLEVVSYCEKHKEAMLFVRSNMGETVRFVTTAPFWTAVFCAYGHVSADRLSEFCSVIRTGMPKSSDDYAAIRLREKLMHAAGALQHGDGGRVSVVKMTMRAIKAFCKRDPIKKIFIPEEFIYPVREL